MDAHTPNNYQDDLSECERRLSGWRPGTEGLDADAMLFAAGLAASQRRQSRLFGPALCGLLALLAVGLGAWGLNERAERLVLASWLREHIPAPEVSPARVMPEPAESVDTPSPSSYLSWRRQIERNPNRWLASQQVSSSGAVGPPPPPAPILSLRQRDRLFD
jgi:hypothetical protein